ncbi:DUF6093 family protein [Frigoribacterium sp. CG_9.8]|uniref:DUF6093 family protein n=1 Tax=Frigoribacterium sp. CG_9.8 TaxID=2787733 RepID=UPI0018CA327E|nr:DUF6093 family protein [Frigoribacterium sp. CG_9.8]MBG6106645.1 hypothetical protein [Frigoribacterium sp. CG_9.8]
MALEIDTDFLGAIRTALVDAGMLRDTIVVLDPQTETVTPYDPLTDTGGVSTPAVVIAPRAAYVQAIGATVATEAGLLQGIVRYRVQFIPEAGDPLVSKGMIVRVLPGGDNPALTQFAFAVLAAPTGSIAALNKLECQSTGTPAAVWVAS